MLLLRCPSRSFTIVGDRAQARHGFTESWQERLERVGLDRVELASLSINYRTPEEVMAEAEPVIRAVLPDANVPTSIRSSGVPVVHGSVAELRLDPRHLARRARRRGSPASSAIPTFRGDVPGPVADARSCRRGSSSTWSSSSTRRRSATGIEGAVDRYVAMTRATQQLVVLTSRDHGRPRRLVRSGGA